MNKITVANEDKSVVTRSAHDSTDFHDQSAILGLELTDCDQCHVLFPCSRLTVIIGHVHIGCAMI
jgi:hypothetical protein